MEYVTLKKNKNKQQQQKRVYVPWKATSKI